MNSEEKKSVSADVKKIKRPALFSKSIFSIIAVVLLTVSVLGFFAYKYGERLSNERRQMYMFSATKATKRQIQNWYKGIISKCKIIRLNHNNESRMYATLCKNISPDNTSTNSQHSGFNKYLEDIEKTLSCKGVMTVSKDGRIVASTDNSNYGLDAGLKTVIVESLNENKIKVSPVILDMQSRKSYIYFIVPFASYKDIKKNIYMPEHAIVITYDIESELSDLLYSASMIKSKTFEELIIFQRGEGLVILNKLETDKRKWMPLIISMTGKKSPSYNAIQGNEGVFNGIDYRGRSVISTLVYIPELKWGVIEKIDRIEAFNILRTIVFFVVGVSLLLIFFLGWFFMGYAKRHGKSAAKKIEKLEQYRTALLNVYPDVIVNIDMKGKILWLNDKGKEFFGEDAIERNISSFITSMSRDVVKEHYYDFLFSGKKTNVTSVQWFRKKSGEERILSWSSCFILDEEGNKKGVLATARDITEDRAVEKRIEESEEYLKTIFSSLIDGIVVIDKEMNITDVNEYICALLGYKRDELIGEKLFKIYPDAGYGLLRKSIERHFEEEVSISGLEINLLTKSEEIIPTSIKAVILKNFEGKVFGSLGLIRDMREVKVLQENLVQAEKLSSVGEMAAGVAHELNNPLTAIIGYSALLMDKKVSEDVKKQIRVINQQSQRCQNIVSNLLMFSRKYEANKEKIDLNELVKSTIALTAYDMRSSGISIEEHYGDNLPPAYIDGNKIQQVLVNLFQNARYAVEKNDNGEKKINVETKLDDKVFRIEVSDTGIGIETDKIKRIFDPFYTTKEVGKGTGLGLSISYGIIKEHNGDIYVRSKLGRGTQFIIKLPVEIREDDNTTEIESVNEAEEIEFGKKSVLVVDDEEVIRDILNLYLTDDGHEVDKTESAVKALEMLKRKKYDIIFSDIRMPDLDGLGFLEKLKKIDESLAKRVVFITGDSMSLESFGKGNGIKNIILTKPFTMDDVKGVFQKVVLSAQ